MSGPFATPRSAGDIAARVESLYGAALEERPAVLHTTALWRDPQGGFRTLKIGPATPASETDRFALGLARARADAILTTGKILREESALRHRYLDDERGDRAFAAWRQRRLGRAQRPESVVLSGGRGIDWEHPLFHDGAPVWVVTDVAAAAALRDKAPAAVRIVGREKPGVRDTLDWLRDRVQCVCVEAGSSTTAALYTNPVLVDELMMSECRVETLPDEVKGPAFEASLEAFELLGRTERVEASGVWRFSRYRRR